MAGRSPAGPGNFLLAKVTGVCTISTASPEPGFKVGVQIKGAGSFIRGVAELLVGCLATGVGSVGVELEGGKE